MTDKLLTFLSFRIFETHIYISSPADLETSDSCLYVTPPPPPHPSPTSTLNCSLSSLQLEEMTDTYTPTPYSLSEAEDMCMSPCSAQPIPPVGSFPLPDDAPNPVQHASLMSQNDTSGSQSCFSDSGSPCSLVCLPDSSLPSMPSSMSSFALPSPHDVYTPGSTCHDNSRHVSVHTSVASFSFPQLAPRQIPPSFCCFLTVSVLLLLFMLCLLVLLIILH